MVRIRRTLWQKKVLCIVLFITLVASIFVACGTRSSAAGTGSISPSNSPTSIVAGFGTAQGCPSDVVVSSAPAADITVELQQGKGIINVHKGEVIEIHLPFGLAWEGPSTSQGVLQLQVPYGYAWKESNACIWRFVAKDTGTVALFFFGRALCKKSHLCVPSVAVASFTFKIN